MLSATLSLATISDNVSRGTYAMKRWAKKKGYQSWQSYRRWFCGRRMWNICIYNPHSSSFNGDYLFWTQEKNKYDKD